jgi:hypothetical protein
VHDPELDQHELEDDRGDYVRRPEDCWQFSLSCCSRPSQNEAHFGASLAAIQRILLSLRKRLGRLPSPLEWPQQQVGHCQKCGAIFLSHRAGILPASPGRTEAAMKQDLFLVGGGIVAVGLAIWGLWGIPRHNAPKEHVAQHLNVDPELKIVSERSPFMRTER